jgi:F-type H+-transporting ATPase subunit gamma
LAGAFSAQVLREAGDLAERLKSEGKEVVYFVLGRKAAQYFQFRQRPMERTWLGGSDQPQFETAKEVADTVIEKFTQDSTEGGVDEIHIVYNRFVSLVTQQPEVVRILPLEVVEGVEEVEETEVFPLYEFEPEPDDVLDALLPRYIETRIFQAMLQSAASEHAARQKAMKSASDNADKLILEYTRLANNARQAEITQQISEIVGGANALQDS